jgi:hypothetical protein
LDELTIRAMSDNAEEGAHFCVDLEYPKEIHDKHADYPLCPEVREVLEEELIEYSKLNEMPKKYNPCRKLVPTLCNKEKYWIHYRNLKVCIETWTKTY